jgi:hypothetical protein
MGTFKAQNVCNVIYIICFLWFGSSTAAKNPEAMFLLLVYVEGSMGRVRRVKYVCYANPVSVFPPNGFYIHRVSCFLLQSSPLPLPLLVAIFRHILSIWNKKTRLKSLIQMHLNEVAGSGNIHKCTI